MFKMEEDESIQEIFDWFSDILNGFKSLGKSYRKLILVEKDYFFIHLKVNTQYTIYSRKVN